jgi:phage shock protein PspC (stress-responsive transcriptional regulator)
LNQIVTGYVEGIGKYGLDLDYVRIEKLKNRREP